MDFYKENKKWILIFAIAIVIILFITVFGDVFSKTEDKNKKQTPVVNLITAVHSFKSGLHDYTGKIMLPNPCYILSVDAVVRESFPEDITIRFTIQEEKRDKVCAQVLTEKGFRIIFQASIEANVHAVVNDIPVQLNIEKEIVIN